MIVGTSRAGAWVILIRCSLGLGRARGNSDYLVDSEGHATGATARGVPPDTSVVANFEPRGKCRQGAVVVIAAADVACGLRYIGCGSPLTECS